MREGLKGKVAIVTGGGSGLGAAIAERLAGHGVKVVVSDINMKSAEQVAQDITGAGGTASAVQQDTARPEDSERVVSHAVSLYGALHYAVNNAGIGGAQAPAGEVDLADWSRVIDINLNGVLYGMRYQIPAMLKAGARSSAIVNMASIHGMVAAIGNGAYTAAKHGVVGSDEKRGCRVRAARAQNQLRGSGVHRNPAFGEPSRRPKTGACRAASSRPARATRGSRSAGLLPSVRRSIVHDGGVLPRGRGLHRGLIGATASTPHVVASGVRGHCRVDTVADLVE
jgi:NAD(P)-dependent dehydrogenase (short-subunit alcohol dehydrogenase family)